MSSTFRDLFGEGLGDVSEVDSRYDPITPGQSITTSGAGFEYFSQFVMGNLPVVTTAHRRRR